MINPPKAPPRPIQAAPKPQLKIVPMAPKAPKKPQKQETVIIDKSEDQPEVVLKKLIHSDSDFKPAEDWESKAKELLASGMDESIVAVKCNITLSKVFEIRRGQPTFTQMQQQNPNQQTSASGEMPSPKGVFARRLTDFNECLEIAIAEYKSDPSSEINHSAMVGFMKIMKDLFESYQDLDDPQESAERLVKQVIYPYMQGMTRQVIESFRNILDDVSPSLVSDFQKEQLKDGLKDGLKKITESTRVEFNRAVKTLEVVFEAKLSNLYMKPQPITGNDSRLGEDDQSEPEQEAA